MKTKRFLTSILACTVISTATVSPLYSTAVDNATSATVSDSSEETPESTAIYYGDGFKLGYEKYSDHITIISCGSSAVNAVVPSEIEGLPVTELEHAFRHCYDLQSVTLPDTIKVIGAETFDKCYSLTEITLPDSVTEIQKMAFSNCTALKSIVIPESVQVIGKQAFAICTSLTDVTIPAGVSASLNADTFVGCTSLSNINVSYDSDSYTSVDGILFSKDMTTLIKYPVTREGSYVIPDTVTSIEAGAFYLCDKLTGITIPDGVTEIKDSLFQNCNGLENVTLGNNVTFIGISAFSGCTNLKNISLGNSVTEIGESAFSKCDSLTSIKFPDTLTSIGKSAFADCTGLKDITLPETLETIGDSAFCNTGLTGITIPDSVTDIGENAFSSCENLSDLTIGKGMTSIKDDTFYLCNSLTDITIPENITSINSYAFAKCVNLSSITIENPDCKVMTNAISNNYYMNLEDKSVKHNYDGVIFGCEDSYAEIYSALNGYKFALIGSDISSATVPEPILIGDANGDSQINASDASAILSIYADISSGKSIDLSKRQFAVADAVPDYEINSTDATLILSYYSYISSGGTSTVYEYAINEFKGV